MKGTEHADTFCHKCTSGFSLAGSDRCSLCTENHYLDTSTGCQPCPTGTYSSKGSIG